MMRTEWASSVTVTIGAGSVVRGRNIVTRDLPANGVYRGAPARLIRELDEAGRSRAAPLTAT
jgi:acetyltransferase-like isoleucine patch superfamily enzyme